MDSANKILSSLDTPLSFSMLQDSTELANGVLQYHIRNSSQITKEKEAVMRKNQCENCSLKKLCGDTCISMVVRKKRKRDILQELRKGSSQREIADNLGISVATVNYHVQDMREKNILNEDSIREEVRRLL
jgi:radical SAM protein with 4Fe4S-binding SPASM domain